MVCHMVLVERPPTVWYWVDLGFGPRDCGGSSPAGWGRRGAGLDPPGARLMLEAAVNQIEQLGFRLEDVRHIVITHFDGDHIGGISLLSRRPDLCHRSGVARCYAHAVPRGESPAIGPTLWCARLQGCRAQPGRREVAGIRVRRRTSTRRSPGIVLISLPGHTRGHACAAVDVGHRWGAALPATPSLQRHCGEHDRRTATMPLCSQLIRDESPHSTGNRCSRPTLGSLTLRAP